MVGVQHISPLLNHIPFFRNRNISFRHSVRLSICAELGVRIPESDLSQREQPYLIAGYGVNAYFDFLMHVCKMFLCIFIFALPLYYYYGKGVGLKGWKSFPVTRFTMGNLGGADMFCKQTSLHRGKMKFNCPSGLRLDTLNAHSGVISSEFESYDMCH